VADPNLVDLLGRAQLVEDRIRRLVASRRSGDPAPDDPFRGLYLSDEAVDALLRPAGPVPPVDPWPRRALDEAAGAAEAAGGELRLRRLAAAARLTALDVDLLVAALVPDLDPRFERLYGYLNDDVTRRRASVGLALELAGALAGSASARARLLPGSPLVDAGLVRVEDVDRPFLTRALRVPDRVTGHLLGDDTPDPDLAPVLTTTNAYGGAAAERLGAALAAGVRLVHLREVRGGSGRPLAAAALRMAGRPALVLDLARMAALSDPAALVTLVGRETLLTGSGLVAGPVDVLAGSAPEVVRALTVLPVPVLLVGTGVWDPAWSDAVPLSVDAPVLTPDDRAQLWRRELDGATRDVDPGPVIAHFALGPDQVHRAVRAATTAAALHGGRVTDDDLRRGARSQNAAGLDRLARRIEPQVSWPDLVLPPSVTAQLQELAARARHRDLVLTQWRMRRGGGRGHGITALFAGDSGTGKTMSAEVIAAELGLDLYTVDLAGVVDKYVGETEKNLERIFREAGEVNGVLLFDEADAVFGKRSEVRDAHDRYANIESAYLLQRMESFDGLAILATNLRANIDDAFTRRLDAIIDFPTPDEGLRRGLWERCLASPLPRGEDLDLDFCARSFELSGGNIRSVAVTAAYLAAAAGGPVGMVEIIAAVTQEYRKLGRLVLAREFGDWLPQPR
jgi:ATPase family associated with various cellular activities (AAA)